jgi:hypothetical protein
MQGIFMRFSILSCCCVLFLIGTAGPTKAGFVSYTSQSTFRSAAPGLAVQDFSAAQVADGSAAFVVGPLNSSTDNAVFNPGDIATGLEISSSGSTQSGGNNLYVAGKGTVGNTAKAIYTNGSDATMSLGFGTGVSAVGLKLIGFTNGSAARRFSLTVVGSISSRTFTTDFINTSGPGQFFGLIGTDGDQIQRISFQSGTGANEGVTSIEFGNAFTAVPEPASLATWMLAGGFGFVIARRRRRVIGA